MRLNWSRNFAAVGSTAVPERNMRVAANEPVIGCGTDQPVNVRLNGAPAQQSISLASDSNGGPFVTCRLYLSTSSVDRTAPVVSVDLRSGWWLGAAGGWKRVLVVRPAAKVRRGWHSAYSHVVLRVLSVCRARASLNFGANRTVKARLHWLHRAIRRCASR